MERSDNNKSAAMRERYNKIEANWVRTPITWARRFRSVATNSDCLS